MVQLIGKPKWQWAGHIEQMADEAEECSSGDCVADETARTDHLPGEICGNIVMLCGFVEKS